MQKSNALSAFSCPWLCFFLPPMKLLLSVVACWLLVVRCLVAWCLTVAVSNHVTNFQLGRLLLLGPVGKPSRSSLSLLMWAQLQLQFVYICSVCHSQPARRPPTAVLLDAVWRLFFVVRAWEWIFCCPLQQLEKCSMECNGAWSSLLAWPVEAINQKLFTLNDECATWFWLLTARSTHLQSYNNYNNYNYNNWSLAIGGSISQNIDRHIYMWYIEIVAANYDNRCNCQLSPKPNALTICSYPAAEQWPSWAAQTDDGSSGFWVEGGGRQGRCVFLFIFPCHVSASRWPLPASGNQRQCTPRRSYMQM